jgi:uncharacterized protein (TIGR02118 family)
MFRISVLYPGGKGKKFDLAYYKDKHMPMVKARLQGFGLARYEVDKGLAGGTPGSEAPFTCAGHLYFNSLEDFQKGMAAHGAEFVADVPNCTDIQPQFQISEIVV